MTDQMMRCVGAAFVLLIGAVIPATATEFHVSPSALPNGNGSTSNPWLINTALQSPTVQPGDTVTLDGGTYVNPTNGQDQIAFKCTISGSSSRPIIVRAAPGRSVKLDGANSQQNDILFVSGSYVWLWGLEIYSSSTVRYSASGGSFPPASEIQRGTCVGITQEHTIAGIKIINCILHDGFLGYCNTSATSTSAELYGCLLYNNGWLASDRNHGHNVYIQNVAGYTRAQNANIIWGAFDQLVQAYGTHNTDDFLFDSNIIFQTASDDGGLLVGGAEVSNNAVITNNFLYQNNSARVIDLGWDPYGAGMNNALVTGNYIGGREVHFRTITNSNISNNTIYYTFMEGASPSDFPNNTWLTSKPTANRVFIIPNAFEAGRANIAVYNWSHDGSVQVDLSSVLKLGDHYKVIDAQNPSVIVASGYYSGPASIPMYGLVAAQPVGPGSGQGQATRTHTAPEFGAFIVVTMAPFDIVNVKVKCYLQGPYVTSNDTMSNGLKRGGQLASHFGAGAVPSLAVDSVNIEIRDSLSASSSTSRAFAPAWLLTDGTIRDFADTTKKFVGFGGVSAGKYYVVVRHRNHLAIVSSARDSVDGSVTPAAYDFSTGQGQAFGINAMVLTGTHYSLISGNASNADQVINASDRVATRNNLGGTNYNLADVNMDGVVNASDRVVVRNNLGKSSQVP